MDNVVIEKEKIVAVIEKDNLDKAKTTRSAKAYKEAIEKARKE